MFLTTASIVTKRLNKSVASTLLRWSLRLPSSMSSFSPMPLAQKLVSIEVQDDYRKLVNGKPVSRWDEFVDSTWDIFFRDMHERNKSQGDGGSADTSVDDRSRGASSLSDEEVERLSEKRISLLEQYLRPALGVSPDDSSDLFDKMRRQKSFVKWVRGEYLIAAFGIQASRAVKKYPELRDDASGISTSVVSGTENAFGQEVEMPLTLPRVQVVRDAFDMRDWSTTKLPVSTWSDDDLLVGNDDASEMAIEQIIHSKLSGQVLNSGPLNAFFEMRRREDSYELWTHEYIFGLSEYLLERIKTMDSEQPLSTTVVDVGSGDGRLCYFLKRAMGLTLQRLLANKPIAVRATKRAKKRQRVQKEDLVLPTVVATDDGSWRAPLYPNPHINVERLSSVEAIAKYRPAENERLIVVCSWMPPDIDFTADWRPSAEEYVLIGEYDTGSCGDNWLTWGNLDFRPTESRDDEPPYVQDGYERVELDQLSSLQFSRFDCKRSSESGTVSFRRRR
mmetsp:Transcript_11837/g.27092  ORF Transcript_11837/g.27092 Transcript_11837/m.27092 type:complete len:505 (-) Transcript_11837:3674-5188(-)